MKHFSVVRLLLDQAKSSLGQCWHVAWMQIKLLVDPENMQRVQLRAEPGPSGCNGSSASWASGAGRPSHTVTKTCEVTSHCLVYEGSEHGGLKAPRAEARRTGTPGGSLSPQLAWGGALNSWRCFYAISRGSTLTWELY